MSPTDPTFQLLRRERRRRRGTLLVWSLVAALSAQAFAAASQLGWIGLDVRWAWILVGVAAGLLGWWFKRAWRLDEAAVARQLDTRWALRSRLETMVELAKNSSALAAAQRTETAQQIAGRRPASIALWSCGVAGLVLVLSLVGIEGAVWMIRGLHAKTAVDAGKPSRAETPPTAEVRASIEWKSPASEIKATAIEEIPWVAYSTSTTGFKTLSLIVDVNGETKLSRAVEDTPTALFGTPGGHEILSSLYLDELGVKPYDVVSYHLVAEIQSPSGNRRVLSPPQFVQIRALEEQLSLGGGGGDPTVARLIAELKDLQLRLLKENFLLLQTSDAKEELVWKKENGRVAAEQEQLQGKADAARAVVAKKPAPPLILDNLKQAGVLMGKAASRIAQAENADAAKPQTQALALITECQKLFKAGLGDQPAGINDPFRDEQRFRLPPRAETPAGQLEALAERQREANELLNTAKTGAGTSAGASEQEAISRQAVSLAENQGLDSQARQLVKTASEAADAASRQLAAKDATAAREPAAVSQAALEQAVAAQESAGRAVASALLEQTRRDLNAASRLENGTQRTQIMDATRAALRNGAIAQQRTGSADAAGRLAQVAEKLAEPATSSSGADKSATSAPNSPARARETATVAAGAQVALASPAEALSRTTRTLRRVHGMLFDPGASSGERTRALVELELTGQEAEWLTGDADIVAQARKLTVESAVLQQAASSGGDDTLHLAEAASQLARALEKARNIGKRDEVVRRFNAEDIDPAYREAVEAYFERLSRDAVKH